MHKIILPCLLIISTITLLNSCKKDANEEIVSSEAISPETLSKIQALGFSNKAVVKDGDGYIVEGDILLTPELLNSTPDHKLLRIGDEEQYRTTNLVKNLPRTITVAVSGLGSAFVQGVDLAISRYNALNLQLKFQRITSGTANITVVGFNQAPSGGYIT
ncbi:MAG TPA: M57 family metalloprotease, partial [Chitinophagaceae bacterium]|nr:M57 family metalloprotease [Chitinophagaceae bacterium]